MHGNVNHRECPRTACRSFLIFSVHLAGMVAAVQLERHCIPQHDIVVHGILYSLSL
jgi:hypothetical protein